MTLSAVFCIGKTDGRSGIWLENCHPGQIAKGIKFIYPGLISSLKAAQVDVDYDEDENTDTTTSQDYLVKQQTLLETCREEIEHNDDESKYI